MYKVIFLLVIFIVIVYIYSYRKLKKTKEKTKAIDSVKYFHDTYSHLTSMTGNDSQRKNTQYTKYVTKYNSSEDYREKS
ncbi:MAG: hypothetical protein PUD93_07885 [Lachnospiraceae bacterium]|nr:hypothetical protein [Lachnospiraceae bacterium]